MDNASLIFNSLNNYDDIKALIGTPEDFFLDFKESRTSTGALLDDDKAHFSKAASGFAHQEGGVLVWGIEARKGEDGIDEATDLKPISNIRGFLSGLNDYVKYSTEPVVSGIMNRVIYENDDESPNKGFAVTFFPMSGSEHRAIGKKWSGFYKRYGDSFVPLPTADIRALFFRNFSPDLELRVLTLATGQLRLSLHNKGRGVAKFLSVQFGLIPHVDGAWFDGGGELNFKTGWMEHNRPEPYGFQFMANASVVVHPDQEICLLVGPTQMGAQKTRILKIVYRLFAESMVPKEGTLKL
jgi:hypothetical protein